MKLPNFLDAKIKAFKPEFSELKFDDHQEFVDWLKKTTKTEIYFEDKGQDFIKLHVAESGEIIHVEVPSLGSIYNGSLLLDDTELIIKGDFVALWLTSSEEVTVIKYGVKKIIRHNNEE